MASQVITLPSPPAPLHCDVSLHVSVSGPSVLPSHFAAVVQSSEQASSPHSVLQSVPAAHVHAESVHEQPVPVQTGSAVSSPPQPMPPKDATRMMLRKAWFMTNLLLA